MQKKKKPTSNFSVLSVWFCFALGDKNCLPYYPGCPETGSVAHARLKTARLPQLDLQVCTTMNCLNDFKKT